MSVFLAAAVGVGAAGVAVLLLRRSARVALVLWLLVVAFVPVWLGLSVVTYVAPATVAGLLVLFSLPPARPGHVTIADWVAGFLVLSLVLPILVSGSTVTSLVVALAQWGAALLLGRIVPRSVGLPFLYRSVAVVFTAVAVLALIEFLLHWNPFVGIVRSGAQYDAWGKLQERGGLVRAEGAFGHSIALGASVALAIPMTLSSSFRLRVKALMVAAMLGCAVITFSRIAMGCAVLAVVLSLYAFRTEISRGIRVGVFVVLGIMLALLLPFVASTFSAAGDEATNSASYRGDLSSLIPGIAPVGFSLSAFRSSSGELYFGRFQSIDSAMLLLGLTYGWAALVFAVLLLLAAAVLVLVRRAAPPTVAIVAALPALVSVALITQYASFLWFVAGVALFAQADQSRAARASTGALPLPRAVLSGGGARAGPPH